MDGKAVCRLCLNLTLSDNCENLEDMQKGMLAVIVPEFNLDLACSPNVICEKCSKLLLESYEFKSACIENSWKENCEETIEEAKKLNGDFTDRLNTRKCCLCLKQIEKELVETPLVVMKLKKCLPELEIVPESKVCETCRPLVETLFTFVTACIYAETKITGYMSLENVDETGEVNLYKIHDHYSFKIVKDEELENKVLHSHSEGVKSINSERVFENGGTGIEPTTVEAEFQMEAENGKLRDSSPVESIKKPGKNTIGENGRNNASSNLKIPIHSYKIVEIEGVPTYVCQLCVFKTKHKYSLRRHHLLIHRTTPDKQTIFCEFCPFTTRWGFAFNEHMATHVDTSELSEEAPSKGIVTMEQSEYKCKKCPFKTKFKQNLSWHSLTHNYMSRTKALLTCSKCNFQTTHERCLKAHKKKGHHNF